MDYAASAEPNPSSIHELGVEARRKLEKSRKEISLVLHSRPEEIIFTSGGTESNNLAIQGIVWNFLEKNSGKIPHIVTTNIEHPSVLETVKMLEKRKIAKVSIVPVEENGIMEPKKIKKELKKNTVLVSVMYANNEIGTIQPVREIAKEIRHFRKNSKSIFPVFHTDAVQASNYLDLNVEKLGVDMLSLSGSKIPEAGRVGVLFKKKSVLLSPVLFGGGQEFGLRPGTENLSGVLKFTKAFLKARKEIEKESKRLFELRSYFLKKIQKVTPNIIVNGDIENRLPNNINITIPKIPSDLFVLELSARGIMVSEKSACKSGDKKASHVIEALRKKGDQNISGSLRFSFGKDTSKKDIDFVIESISQIREKLSKWYL